MNESAGPRLVGVGGPVDSRMPPKGSAPMTEASPNAAPSASNSTEAAFFPRGGSASEARASEARGMRPEAREVPRVICSGGGAGREEEGEVASMRTRGAEPRGRASLLPFLARAGGWRRSSG